MTNATNSAYDMALLSRSEPERVDPSEVASWVLSTRFTESEDIAIATLLVYDAIITMDKEVRYFWTTPRKAVNFIYFVNRYLGISAEVAFILWDSYGVSTAKCRFAQWMNSISHWATVVLIDYILTIRVLALYCQDRKLSICLKTAVVLEAAVKLGILIYTYHVVNFTAAILVEDITVCGIDLPPPWQLGVATWTIPLVYGVILMALALYKAAEYWRLSSGFTGFTLVKVLIEDQVIYFAFVIGCAALNILNYKVEFSSTYVALVSSTLGNPALLCILGSRMLFNLKEAGERGQNEGTSYRVPSQTLSRMQFA